jgi:hypothetical protein
MSDRIDWWFIHTTADIWAAWGQWVGGIGTTIAVAIALWVALGDRRHRNSERRDAEAQDARQFLIYPRVSDRELQLLLQNSSDTAIIMLAIDSVHVRSATNEVTVGWSIDNKAQARLLRGLGPGEAVEFPVNLLWSSATGSVDPELEDSTVTATVRFTDGRGRRWMRSNHYEPVRVLRKRGLPLWISNYRHHRDYQALRANRQET